MPGKINTFYWDTCVFLAWIKNETRAPGEMEGVVSCVDAFHRRTANVVTSALTFSEITPAKVPSNALDILDGLLRRKNASVINVDRRIAKLASELRDFYQRDPAKWNNLTLSTPDAIHLATAILYGVDQFHTFDEKDNNKSLGLLPRDGDIAGHPLEIKKPGDNQQMILHLAGDARDADEGEDEDEDGDDQEDS